jgi:hypothetical protein
MLDLTDIQPTYLISMRAHYEPLSMPSIPCLIQVAGSHLVRTDHAPYCIFPALPNAFHLLGAFNQRLIFLFLCIQTKVGRKKARVSSDFVKSKPTFSFL